MQWLFPGLPINPAAFAVAGMAGVVGGSTGAALAAVVMIFEMTLDYAVIIPMTITVALSYGVRKGLLRQSIYTLKLARRGHDIPNAPPGQLLPPEENTGHHGHPVRGRPGQREHRGLRADRVGAAGRLLFPGGRAGGLVGFLTRDAAPRPARQSENRWGARKPAEAGFRLEDQVQSWSASPPESPEGQVTLAELADRRFVTVGETTPLLDVMTRLRAAGASVALVTDDKGEVSGGRLRGVIAKHQIANAVIDGMELFAA